MDFKLEKRHWKISLLVLVLALFTAGCALNSSQSGSTASTNIVDGYSYNDENMVDCDDILLADYHGQVVYQTDVNYYKKVNGFFSSDVTQTPLTEKEILDKILENMVLYDEAERLGLTATQAEIDEMVSNAKLAYTLPEGKEILDQYCEKAKITVDEYFELLENQAPRTIAQQKLMDFAGQKFCEENGLIFTKVNPPKELVEAKEAYINDLFNQAKEDIKYYSD